MSLSNNNIGDQGANELAHALIKNYNIHKLKLESNNIGPIGAKSLYEAITQTKKLIYIGLENNQGGEELLVITQELASNDILFYSA